MNEVAGQRTSTAWRILPLLLVLLTWPSPPRAAVPEPDSDRRGVKWAGFPIFNYSTDLGLKIGALGRRFDYGDGRLPFTQLWSLEASFANRGPATFWLSWEANEVWDSAWRLSIEAGASRNPYETYFGLGSSTSFDLELRSSGYYEYTYRTAAVAASGRRKLELLSGGELELGLAAESELSSSRGDATLFSRDFGSGDLSEESLQLRTGVLFDRRDSEFIPSKGWLAAAAFTTGIRTGSSGLERQPPWGRLDLDYRRYDPLVSSRWLVFASQARFAATTEHAPLHDKARLGSLGSVRGLPLNRYLSNTAFTLRAELRSVWLRFRAFDQPLKGGAGLFIDSGRIAENVPLLASTPTRVAWGVTAFGSYFTDDFLGSADLGFSRDGTALYLRLGHAF